MSRLTHVASGPYAPPAPARELTAMSADGARLHVEVHGPLDATAAPAVVLAHGWTCSTAFWAAQIRELAVDHRVIAYDQRGHGRSPASPACSSDALADDLEAVLEATLAPGEKAVIVGHSMGGMTVMAAAGRPGFRAHAAAVLLCSTGASRLVAESTVVPMRPGRLRTWLTKHILGSRAPLGPVTPIARGFSSTRRWAPVRPRTWSRHARGSCTRARARCGTPGRTCWICSISTTACGS